MPKILLVEDDNNLREIYEARLQAEGYNIVSAKDGEEALVVAKAEKPDLIISDVMMPKISGFEMLDILRNTPELKDTRVVMLTALGQAEDQSRASHLGADRYLVKSQVTLEDIVKVAHELLNDNPQPPVEEPASTAVAPAEPVAPATPPQPQEMAVNPEPSVELPVVPPPTPAPVEEPKAEAPAPTLVNAATPSASDMPAAEPYPPVAAAPTGPAGDIAIDSSGQMSATDLAAPTPVDQPVVPEQMPGATPDLNMPSPDNAPLNADQAANVETLTQAVNDLASETPQPAQSGLDSGATESSDPNITPGDSSVPDYSPATVVSGKKIVKPLDQPPQRSLDELLAIEDASQPQPPQPPPEPVVMDPKAPFDASDPNNIAL